MPRRCSHRPRTWLSLAALCLCAVCATASTAGAQPGTADPPKPLPEEIVQVWTKAGARVGWMGVDKFGQLSFADKMDGSTGAVPAFRFDAWQDGQLAGLPVPAAVFGLDLNNTQVTDAGLKELAGLQSLQTLVLFGTQVTDAGLKELAGLKSLRELWLGDTQVTDAGVAQLRQALPNCRIW